MHDRKHLVAAEVEKLMEAAKGCRNAARDPVLVSDLPRCIVIFVVDKLCVHTAIRLRERRKPSFRRTSR